MFGHTLNYENKFFIADQEVVGLDSLDLSYSHSQRLANFLGSKVGHTLVSGPVQQKLSLSHHVFYVDPILSYTGDVCMSGNISYQGSSYGFKSGYLEEYSVNCAIGSIPKASANIVIFDELRSGINESFGVFAAPTFHMPNQGSISASCDGSATNRVVGFDFSVKSARTPVYAIGQKSAAEVFSSPVLEYSASVQIDVDDAFLSSGFAFFSGVDKKVVTFSIKGRDNTPLYNWTIPKASLVGESLSSSADGGLKLTLNYIGHS